MKNISVFGVGRSSYYLLEYLNRRAFDFGWKITAYDKDISHVIEKTKDRKNITALQADIENTEQLNSIIAASDLTISLLPPAMHMLVAKACLQYNSHLATASYISAEMRALDEEAKSKGLIFINECGLDPGIDHMSAMKLIHHWKKRGAEIFSFESYCGGLIAEADCGDNPWKYKFSWNPMNVILAGQGGKSKWLENNEVIEVNPESVFEKERTIEIQSLGMFDFYPNRDSISYIDQYGLQNADTFIRGTLRRRHFCKAWNVLVQLGFTDHQKILSADINSFQSLAELLTGIHQNESFSEWLVSNQKIDVWLKRHFEFLENGSKNIALNGTTAADKLLELLMVLWKLDAADRDEVVMYHRLGMRHEGKAFYLESALNVLGTDAQHTAMAKTVGLPLALASEAVLTDRIKARGVMAPVTEEWYAYILPALEKEGIGFVERVS